MVDVSTMKKEEVGSYRACDKVVKIAVVMLKYGGGGSKSVHRKN